MPPESRALSNKKRDLRFIITDPSSNQDRGESIREIRSHAGYWRWDKARRNRDKDGPSIPTAIKKDTSVVSVKDEGRTEVLEEEDEDEEGEETRSDGLYTSSEPSIRVSPVTTTATGLDSQTSPEAGLSITRNAVTLASHAARAKNSNLAGKQPASYQDSPNVAKSIGADMVDPFETCLPSSLPQQVVTTALKYCMINLLPCHDRADLFF